MTEHRTFSFKFDFSFPFKPGVIPSVKLGFSLIELLIVIAIMSILVAIAIPSYQIYTRRAHYTEVVNAATPYKLGVEECFQITGTLTDCSDGKNGVPPNFNAEQADGMVATIQVPAQGEIIVTPQEKHGIVASDTYILTPHIQQGMLRWQTSGGGVAQGYAN